jgi:adenine-specific DNA-methyltransferase
MIGFLINSVVMNNKSSIILDFFAGSGTTLHATMKLNAEDGGKRQCILVQQKEGDKNICESVTYERNKRVMQGYTNAKGEKVEGLGNSLKYYRTAFVGNHDAATATDEDKVALAHKAGCLIAIAENTLEEIEANNAYQIFQDGTRYTAVYFSGNLGDMPEFTEKLESLRDSSRLIKIEAYIYCLGNVQQFENEFVSLRRITLHAIPQPIIEIYKQLNA